MYQSRRMTQVTPGRESPKAVRGRQRRRMVDVFMTYGAVIVTGRIMTLYTMPVQWTRPSHPVTGRFRFLMAFQAHVLFMTYRALGPIPFGTQPMPGSPPGGRMTLGWVFRMAILAKRFVFMAHHTEFGVITGHLAVRGFPYLRRVMRNPHRAMAGRAGRFAHLRMAYGAFIQFGIRFAMTIHAEGHAFIGMLDGFR